MAKAKPKRATRDALEILDRRFGTSEDRAAQHERFTEQAEVAEMLFAAREAAGLTQKQLAKLAGTTQQVISQLESADYEGHSLSMLSRIADALGYSVAVSFLPRSANGAAPRRRTPVQRKPRRATPKTRAT
jgi:ribosome-binding protein aMBF1 (putative translation factor)